MRKQIKTILRFLHLGPCTRAIRRLAIGTADAVGHIIFSLLKIVRVTCPDIPFDKNQVGKILLIRIDRLGDVVLTTPAIRAVRQSYPQSSIHLLVSKYTRDVIIKNSNVDRIVLYGEEKLSDNYDLALVFHPGMTPNRIAFLSGAKWRIGFAGYGGSFYLTHKLYSNSALIEKHQVESALEVAAAAQCRIDDKRLEISVTETGEHFANQFFALNNIAEDDLVVIIHPGARQEYIRWRKSGFAEVADRLIQETNAKVILTGSSEESYLVDQVAFLMKETPIKVTGADLSGTISVIRRAKLFIGNSTGPMHMAAALKVPVIAIFCSNHPRDSILAWGPWRTESITFFPTNEQSSKHPTDYNVEKNKEEISAGKVYSAAIDLLDVTN